MDSRQHWIVTVDNRCTALFSCRKITGGALHIEQVRTLKNGHEADHEHHRPTLIGGSERVGTIGRSGGGVRAAPHSVSVGHEREEERRRFAREIGNWLGAAKELVADQTGGLTVFAPPGMLALLRGEFASSGSGAGHRGVGAEVREAELTHLRPHELAEHPAIRAALGFGT